MGKNIIPIILCGGSGSRLWPLSRQSFPKQFLELSENKKSLLQNTALRINDLKNVVDPILICNEEHRFLAAEQMREINIKPSSIILEPIGRNTGPAIALAALKALANEDNPIMIVLSSDHAIRDEQKFLEIVELGISFALEEKIVTFGVVPNKPETGYGYIKSINPFVLNHIKGENIEKFIEKPDLASAKKFIKDRRFTWNSGIFMFQAQTVIDEMNKFCPDIVNLCTKSLDNSSNDLDFQRIGKEFFKKCPNVSFDVSIMEKTNKGIVLPLDAQWSDVGSWQSVWETANKNNEGNTIIGKVLQEDTKNSYLRSEKRLLVSIGLRDIIAIETSDAILISEKSKSQKVKYIVNQLKDKNIMEGQKHNRIYRPWGYYESLAEDLRWQVKLIKVKPEEKLSLQMHHHRSEHWIIVKGTAKVEIEKNIDILTENQSIYIPLGSKHRLTNPGKIPLILIEVQSGSYVGEDDIVRFEDIYGRINK
ncbi:Mannose-1-phosphate guanylyltransferase (GDP) [Prochlorococcus marinus str. MIT 9201]|uniref:mannose-1-phosphate guanylyltransferase n=1 Tax=Prochlorococcus marinus str. MIT 9201 TaxID=93057 RepID=A0A0A2A503_PROMR|nr:mannose-1-phosphate guanylyltransferase/mannose-6-phosphate isomerase [Prochlorococcus marinus]KGF96685.1 Mannose-1-phosphate guanylyltransferase (GDP) [Prochlorococcus marinus str. MIT 9201]